MRDAKPLAAPPDAEAKAQARAAGAMLGDLEARRLVFVDGAFIPELSDLAGLDHGLTVMSLADALAEGDVNALSHLGRLAPASDMAVALNTAFMGDGAVIRIDRDATIERPLHLLFVASKKPAATFVRSLVSVAPGARAMLIESHEGPAGTDYQVNAALELFVGERAHLDHVKIIGEGIDALHVSTLAAAVGPKARFNVFAFITGGAVVRNQMFLNFDGDDTIAGLRGASLLKGRQHADTTLVANHIARGCQSREMFKAVLDGQAHSVFQGRIIVRHGAQKTDAKMMTQALLLSDSAEADNKPELEIFADDVQCGHGATAGALDEELKFYLMARGIPAAEAEALLIQAFLGEAIEGIEHAGLREVLMDQVVGWLKARGRQ
jgi:Fe-S cluster assembly protein SufD